MPCDIDIEPSLVSYMYQDSELVDVHISNVTTRTVTIQPNAILCEMQPVGITDHNFDQLNTSAPDIDNKLSKLDIADSTISRSERQQLEQLILDHQDVFSMGDTDIGHTTAVKHRIELNDNVPFKQRHRRIPPRCLRRS